VSLASEIEIEMQNAAWSGMEREIALKLEVRLRYRHSIDESEGVYVCM
jgi:hypothetical protein